MKLWQNKINQKVKKTENRKNQQKEITATMTVVALVTANIRSGNCHIIKTKKY